MNQQESRGRNMKSGKFRKIGWIALWTVALAFGPTLRAAYADDPNIAGPTTFVRVLHALALGSKVDVYIDEKKTLNDVEFSAVTKYLRLPAGVHSFRITTNNPTRTLVSGPTRLRAGDFYTVGIYGTPRTMRVLLANDSMGTPATGAAQLTVYHLSPGLPPFDVHAYLPGGRIRPLIRNVRYGQARRASIPAIPMTVRLVRQGRILKTHTGAAPRAGRKYAAYAIGRPSRNFRLMLDVTASQ